jgi:ABC-type nitrate/sulfonate/bicarbonate transport system substrate-binding protein
MGAGLALSPGFLGAAERDGPLSMGYQTNLVGLVGLVADEERLYDKLHARVDVHRFASGQAVRDAMVSKHIDIGAVGSTPFIIGVTKAEMVAVGVVAYTGKMCMVVARKGSGIKSVADLKGRRIASQVGSQTDHAFQAKIAPKFGLSKSDYQVVNVAFENHVAALSGGSVDAFAGVDPFTAVAEYEGLGVVLVDYEKYDLLPSMLAVNSTVLRQRPDDVVAFLKGWLAGVKIVREDPARATAIAVKLFRSQGYSVPDAVIARAVSRVDVEPTFRPGLKEYLAEQSQQLYQQKKISSIPDWSKALVSGPLQRAAAS